MRRQNNYTKITLTGLNLERFINILRDKDIEIYNIHRDNNSSMSMYVNDNDISYIRENSGSIDIEIREHYGIKQWFRYLLDRIGLVIGVLLSIVMIIILNMYTLHISIIGLETIEESVVIEALNNYGIYKGKINKYDNDDLNKYLIKTINGISLVSTERKGTALIINIKEKSSTLEETAQSYVSPYNMIINDYEVFSGISNMVIGQVVKKGDVLIYPQEYIDSDGVLHLNAPKAKLMVTLWYTATEVLMKEETVYVRTGEYTTNFSYTLGSMTIIQHNEDNSYNYFDTETKVQNISSVILPIKYSETTYYETKPEIRVNDFEKLKEKIIANLKDKVYNKLNGNEKVVDEIVDVVELSDRYIVNTYLQCDLELYIGE